MTDVIDWGLLILAITIAVWFVILLFKVFFVDKTNPKEIKIALIGVAATVVTILGAVKTAQDTNASNAALQRAAEVRKIKQQYYNAYWEAFWKKHACLNTTPNDKQAQLQADLALCMEAGRLPLYASQAFTELVGRTMQNTNEAAKVTIAQMYEVMRDDLASDDYARFKHLKFDYIMFPLPLKSRGVDCTAEKNQTNESQQSVSPLPLAPQMGHSDGAR